MTLSLNDRFVKILAIWTHKDTLFFSSDSVFLNFLLKLSCWCCLLHITIIIMRRILYSPYLCLCIAWFYLSRIYVRRNQVTLLVYGQDSQKKIGSVGRQNENNIICLLGSVFFKNILHSKHRRKTCNL